MEVYELELADADRLLEAGGLDVDDLAGDEALGADASGELGDRADEIGG